MWYAIFQLKRSATNEKILLLLALLGMLSYLSACGGESAPPKNTDTPKPSETIEQGESPTETHSLDELNDLNVEKNLFSVEFTVPSSFVEDGITQESLDEAVKDNGYKSATLNEDGSVTYVMTKDQHQEIMDGIKTNIDETLFEMIESEEYPSFKSIKTNEDYTEFTIETTSKELGLNESISVIGFYMYGGLYNAFNGTEPSDIAVIFVNSETGEIISESRSSEMG